MEGSEKNRGWERSNVRKKKSLRKARSGCREGLEDKTQHCRREKNLKGIWGTSGEEKGALTRCKEKRSWETKKRASIENLNWVHDKVGTDRGQGSNNKINKEVTTLVKKSKEKKLSGGDCKGDMLSSESR